MLREMLLGRAHALHVRQLGVALFVEHLAEQTSVGRIVFDQENRIERFHCFIRFGSVAAT
jgi:hypothetical protein